MYLVHIEGSEGGSEDADSNVYYSGVGCTGRNTLLQPGEHTSSEPVYVDSVLCYP